MNGGDDSVTETNNESSRLSDCRENIQETPKIKRVSKQSAVAKDASQKSAGRRRSPEVEEVPKKRKKLSRGQKTTSVIDQSSQNINTVHGDNTETHESEPANCSSRSLMCNESTAPDSTSKIDCETQTSKSGGKNNFDTNISPCLSWTKEISSSSSITCVTVNSHDYVRIGKKMPIVQLTNVDDQINGNNHVDTLFEENSFDSAQQKSIYPSVCSSVSIGDLNVSQTLNLSTSSFTSVSNITTEQNICTSQDNKEERMIKLQQSLQNLSFKMKNFDLEIMNWIGYENDSKEWNTKNFNAHIFEVFNDEKEVIRCCKEIKRVLGVDQQSAEVITECPNKIDEACLEVSDNSLTLRYHPDNDTGDFVERNEDIHNTDSKSKNDKATENNPDYNDTLNESKLWNTNVNVTDNDDDDALSLFAESITGLESSRKNSSIANSISNDKSIIKPDVGETLVRNENLTKPISNIEYNIKPASYEALCNVKKHTADSSTVFNRVSASDLTNEFESKNNGIFENVRHHIIDKHNFGDDYNRSSHISDLAANNHLNRNLFSNSIGLRNIPHTSESFNYKSPEFQNHRSRTFPYSFQNSSLNVSQDLAGIVNNTSEISNINTNVNGECANDSDNSNFTNDQYNQSINNQLEMASKHFHVLSSRIFKGICIFNLVSICKNAVCNYPHKTITIESVVCKLQHMKEEHLIKESMFLIKWPILYHRYGICFVEECIRRNLTIWLLHLLKELVIKSKVKSREDQDMIIRISEDTLLHLNEVELEPSGNMLRASVKPNICLCDHLIKIISETQNFSRFRKIFIKLTSFMCRIGRSFTLDVATQLLERLCILPYDEALARALVNIVAKTNSNIFKVPMMKVFENHLSKSNAALYKELMGMKLQTERYSQNLVMPPMQSLVVASSNVGHPASTPIPRADSPDTTNTDFVQNKTSEPVITRTITINRTINTGSFSRSAASDSSEEPAARFDPRRAHRPRPSLSPRPPHRRVYRGFASARRSFNGAPSNFRWRPPLEPY